MTQTSLNPDPSNQKHAGVHIPFEKAVPESFQINLTTTATIPNLLNNGHTFEQHQKQTQAVQKSYKNLTQQLQKYTTTISKEPGIAAISLKEANHHLTTLTNTVQPILNKLEAKHADITSAINTTIAGAQQKQKQYSNSSDPTGRETRDFVKDIYFKEGEKGIKKLIETPAENSQSKYPQEFWAALSQSPVAKMYLTEGQQRICQANVLTTSAIDFPDLQKQEQTLDTEIRSINSQINTLKSFIGNSTNKLKTLYPNSFQGL